MRVSIIVIIIQRPTCGRISYIPLHIIYIYMLGVHARDRRVCDAYIRTDDRENVHVDGQP
jgi:hypothetical protein